MSAFLIHISAFLRKEIFEILRQPKLLLTLVAGPFLILLIFGIGNTGGARTLTIQFVADEGSQAERFIKDFANRVTGSLVIQKVTDDDTQALRDLRDGKVDLVAVAPGDPMAIVRDNKQAPFGLYHNEIDPVQAGYVTFLWDYFINEINRQLLEDVIKKAQAESGEVESLLSNAKTSATSMRTALEAGNVVQARASYQALVKPVNGMQSSIGTTADMLDGLSNAMAGAEAGAQPNSGALIRTTLNDMRSDVAALEAIKDGQASYDTEVTTVRRIETRLDEMSRSVAEFKGLGPNIVVRPLRANAQSLSPVSLNVMSYFAPSVIVLLIQHLLITMSALSLVRERMNGSLELFRASPFSPLEVLVGKYLSYMVLGIVLTAILTAALILLLQVPMQGSWLTFGLVALALLFASLGWGTFISIISDNDTQAVQYSMLMLLGSVFFSGAFLALYNIAFPPQYISWLLPATYAIQLFQGVMLRGQLMSVNVGWGLLAMGVLFFIVNYLLLSRKMARE
jgi:ABC-2 type transport system permease protein